VAQLYSRALGSLFIASYDTPGYDGVFDPSSTRGHESMNIPRRFYVVYTSDDCIFYAKRNA
jgi:hypothetical protein